MRCRFTFFIVIILIILLSTISTYADDDGTYQQKLDALLVKLDIAQEYLHDNKITELRNIMWDEVNPPLQLIINQLDNNIQVVKDVDIYDFTELNISQGDIKRGIEMFERTKVDATYAINNNIFDEKLPDTRDAIIEFKKIIQLIPTNNIEYTKKNEQENFSNSILDKFSIYVRDIDTYRHIKKMNVTEVNHIVEIRKDESTYTFASDTLPNITTTVKVISKKLKTKEQINNVEIYEVFNEDINASNLIFKTTYSLNNSGNKILLYKGDIVPNRIIPVTFITKTNLSSEMLSQTIIVINEAKPTSEVEIITPKPKKEPVSFGKIELETKINYLPYIILGILIIVFLLLIINTLITKEKLAKDLAQYRKKINILKGNK